MPARAGQALSRSLPEALDFGPLPHYINAHDRRPAALPSLQSRPAGQCRRRGALRRRRGTAPPSPDGRASCRWRGSRSRWKSRKTRAHPLRPGLPLWGPMSPRPVSSAWSRLPAHMERDFSRELHFAGRPVRHKAAESVPSWCWIPTPRRARRRSQPAFRPGRPRAGGICPVPGALSPPSRCGICGPKPTRKPPRESPFAVLKGLKSGL